MPDTTMSNGNGTVSKVLAVLGRIVFAVFTVGGVMVEIIYGYAVLCTRVEAVELTVNKHEARIEQIDKTYIDVREDLREIKTDLKWIRQRVQSSIDQ